MDGDRLLIITEQAKQCLRSGDIRDWMDLKIALENLGETESVQPGYFDRVERQL